MTLITREKLHYLLYDNGMFLICKTLHSIHRSMVYAKIMECFLFVKPCTLFTKACFMPSLVKIDQTVLEKIFNLFFCDYLPEEKEVVLSWNKLDFPSSKNALC